MAQFNRVGLLFQPANGTLTVDEASGVMEFQDNVGSKTVLVGGDQTLQRATWSEMGAQGSLQLYMEGFDDDDAIEIKRDDTDVENEREKLNGDKQDGEKKGKDLIVPKYYRVHSLNNRDDETMKRFLKQHANIDLEPEPWGVRGGNFGKVTVSKMKRSVVLADFEEESRPAIELPLSNVSQVAAPTKGELEIQYTHPVSEKKTDGFELSLVRIHIPNQEEEVKNDELELDERLYKSMKAVSDLYDEADEISGLICKIPDEDTFIFNVPRGRFTVEVYQDYFKMRGTTYNFKISYPTMTSMHLLDHPEGDKKYLLLTLNVPLRAGQQRHNHLVMSIDDDDDEQLELEPSEEDIKTRYGDKGLEKVMKGPRPEMIAKLLKGVSGKKVFVMPKDGFTAAREDGHMDDGKRDRCVRCNYKTNAGALFPMKSVMFFLHKPVLHIRYDAIQSIEFKRNSSGGKTFDIQVDMKNADAGVPKMVEFIQISRKQFEVLRAFFEQSKVPIKNKSQLTNLFSGDAGPVVEKKTTIFDIGSDDDDEDDEEDSDFDADSAEQARKARKEERKAERLTRKKEGENADGAPKEEENEDDDESSSDDSDGSSSGTSDDETDSQMAEEVSIASDELPANALDEIVHHKRKPGGSAEAEKAKRDKREKELKRLEADKGGEKKKDKSSKKEKKDKDKDKEKKEKSKATSSPQKEEPPAKKKQKDPNAPKAARTAYQYFFERHRLELKEQGLEFGEISKRMSEMWKSTTDRSEFEELAKKDKVRFEEENAKYQPATTSSSKDGPPASKKKDPNAPKGARTAFVFFSTENRPMLMKEGEAKLSLTDASKKLGEMWKAMSEADKEKYNEMAKEDKVRYNNEMEAYSGQAGKKDKKRSTASASAGPAEESKSKKVKLGGGGILEANSDSSSDDSSSDDKE